MAEEKLFHLPGDEFLSFLGGGSQAILVDEHPQMVHPLIPGFLRDMIVDPRDLEALCRASHISPFVVTLDLLVHSFR